VVVFIAMQRFAYWIVEAWLQLCGVLVDQCTVDFILVSSPKGYIFTLSSTKGMINCEEWELRMEIISRCS